MSSPKVIVLLGPPGSGKGTQASKLQETEPGYLHVSTGNLFRKEINSASTLGLSVKDIIASGKLVPDDVTNRVFESQVHLLLKEHPGAMGLLLDGYPRTAAQSQFLVDFASRAKLPAPFAVELEVSEGEVVARLSGRLVNPRTGKVYHVTSNPPKKAGICDEDGQNLIQRPDDQPDTIRSRYKLYQEQRDGIVAALGGPSKLLKVAGIGDPPKVAMKLKEAIQKSR